MSGGQFISTKARSGTKMAATIGGFEGADARDRSLITWRPRIMTPDAANNPAAKNIIIGRTEDSTRNDAYIQGAVNIRRDNIVGDHFRLSAHPSSRIAFGKKDVVLEEELQAELEERFELIADSDNNWLDAAGKNNFTELVRANAAIDMIRGETISVSRWIDEPGRPCRTAVSLISGNRLKTNPLSMADEYVRDGIRFNADGKPISYQFLEGDPYDFGGGVMGLSKSCLWTEIPRVLPWGRMNVLHMFEQLGASQSRGVAELASCLKELKTTKDFRQISLQQAIIQGMYPAAIESPLPTDEIFKQLGQLKSPGSAFDPAVAQSMVSNFQEALAASSASMGDIRVDGVKIPHLPPGTKLNMFPPTGIQGRGGEFEQSLLRYIAAALGISYEQLSRDYTNTTYSSTKATFAETLKFMRAKKRVCADRFASYVYRLLVEEWISAGILETLPKEARATGWLWEVPSRLDAIAKCSWIGASRGQIDELKESQAAMLRIWGGLSTRRDEIAALGKDWREVYHQQAREQALADELKLTFSSGSVTKPTAATIGSSGEDDEGGEDE